MATVTVHKNDIERFVPNQVEMNKLLSLFSGDEIDLAEIAKKSASQALWLLDHSRLSLFERSRIMADIASSFSDLLDPSDKAFFESICNADQRSFSSLIAIDPEERKLNEESKCRILMRTVNVRGLCIEAMQTLGVSEGDINASVIESLGS